MKERMKKFLRWSERYTRIDMVYLARGGFWLTSEQMLIGLFAFAVSVALARYLPKDVYGTYRYLLSLFWTLSAFSLTGISTALVRAVARGEEGAYPVAIRLIFFGALPVSLIAGGIAIHYYLLGNLTLAYGAAGIAFLTPFFQAAYLYGSYLDGKREFGANALGGIILSLIPSLALLAALFFSPTALSLFWTYLVSNVLTAIVISFFVFRRYRPNHTPSTELPSYGLHLSGINILGTLAGQLDQLLVFHYLGAADLAAYALATSLPDQMKSMVTNIGNIAFPKFATGSIIEIRRTMRYRILLLTLTVAVGIAAYLALTPWFFSIFFPKYLEAVPYSRAYALTILAIGSIIPATALQAQAAKRELYLYNIISSVVQIAALFIGIIEGGLWGVIAARGASRVFNFCFSYLLVGSAARTKS